MAALRPASKFIRVDLPAFTGPASTTESPFRIISPIFRSSSACSSAAHSAAVSCSISRRKASGNSSSAKSIIASRWASNRAIFSRQNPTGRLSWPAIWAVAWRRCREVSASIRSASPSAAVISILPLSRARRVNSPGSAARNPECCERVVKISSMTAADP